mgnify:CR=1 FL=1
MEERLVNKLTAYSPVFGLQSGTLTGQFKKNAVLLLSDKRYSYKVAYGYVGASKPAEEFIGNKDFYDISAPLAPIKYDRYLSTLSMNKENRTVTFTIDQTFPKKYEKIR